MASPTTISASKLFRLVGTLAAPEIIDVRSDEDFSADPRLIPGAVQRSYSGVALWAGATGGERSVIVCHEGKKLSEGVAAWLRHAGRRSEVLEDGFAGWAGQGLPLVPADRIPTRNESGSTVWVTRTRPKIDRIACPWLIRRFVDPQAVFLFVAPQEVEGVAVRFDATPIDIEAAFWSHRGELCSFDTMLEEFHLKTAPLLRLARIVRGADTARPDLAPEAPGLLAVSLGLSRMFSDDLAQLDAGMLIYDALYRRCRDATDETHNWPSPKPMASK